MITVRYLLPFLFLVFATQVSAQQSRFDSANEMLNKNLYSDAIELYQSIADEGYESGALWLNTGYAYTQIDSLGMAKVYLLKAKNHKETAALAEDALAYVNERFSRRSAVLPPLPWIRFFNFLSDSFGITALAITALILFYLATAFLIGSWFRVDFKKPMRIAFYSCLSGAALLFLITWVIHYQDVRYDRAVMVERESTVYQYPREDAAVITTAFEGYLLEIDNHQSQAETGWHYIRLENGMYGWIRNDGIRVL